MIKQQLTTNIWFSYTVGSVRLTDLLKTYKYDPSPQTKFLITPLALRY